MLLPIARLVLAWLVGIALADALAPGPLAPALLAGAAAVACWVARGRPAPAPRPAAAAGTGPGSAFATAIAGQAGAAAPARAARRRAFLFLTLALALGALRRELDREDLGPGHVAAANDRGPIVLVGRVTAAPLRRERGLAYRLSLQAHPRAATGAPTRGLLLLEGPSHPVYRYGDLLRVEGEPQAPPRKPDFDYRAFLARQGVHSLMVRPRIERLEAGGGAGWRRALIAWRERGARALAAALPEPEAALVTGILLGDDSGLPRRLKEAFRASNTSHVIAISGANIALLIAFLSAVLGRLLGKRRAFLPILGLVLASSLLVGGDAAVLRAALMGGLGLLALRLGRAADAQAGLCAAAWLLTAYQPQVLWDLGFQLSFAATAGLIRFAAPLQAAGQAWLERRLPPLRAARLNGLLAEILYLTLIAQLCTWPLIAFATGQVSLVGLLANALILPAQPPLMALGALALAGQLLHPLAGGILGALAWLPATWTLRVVALCGGLPGASLTWRLPAAALAAWYLALVGLAHRGWRAGLGRALRRGKAWVRRRGADARRAGSAAEPGWVRRPSSQAALRAPSASWTARRSGHHATWLALLLLGAAAILAWTAAAYRPDGLLHLHLLDVGQGDALLLVSPNGRRLLIDGGPSPPALLAQLGRLTAPWDRRLDLLLLSHPDADHVGGLPELLRRYRVGAVLDPELPAESPDAAAWMAALEERPLTRYRAGAGGRIDLDQAAGLRLEILWPPDPRLSGVESPTNENAVVLRLRYGALSALFTGDIGAPAEEALLARGLDLRTELLKVAHHGSRGSSTAAFLAAVRPRAALIGVGEGNRYGHPAPEALERLAAAGVTRIWRTDQDGRVELVSDGRRWWRP